MVLKGGTRGSSLGSWVLLGSHVVTRLKSLLEQEAAQTVSMKRCQQSVSFRLAEVTPEQDITLVAIVYMRRKEDSSASCF